MTPVVLQWWLRPTAFVYRTNIIYTIYSVSRRFNVLCMVFGIGTRVFFYTFINTAHQIICGGWRFNHMFKNTGLECLHHFTESWCFGPLKICNSIIFYRNVCTIHGKWAIMYMCIRVSILYLFLWFSAETIINDGFS